MRAVEMGYFGSKRRKPGEVFEMPDKLVTKGKDGKVVSPKWVEQVGTSTPLSKGKEAAEAATPDPDEES